MASPLSWSGFLGIALLPQITFWAGSFTMRRLTERRKVVQRLKDRPRRDRLPLNQRLFGYDLAAVQRHWGALDPPLLDAERRALRLDLLFPLLYGSAFVVSLALASRRLNPPVDPVWLIAPVGICVLADWTENLIQLQQLRLYRKDGPKALDPRRIRTASLATKVKLLFFAGCSVLIVALLLKK